MIETIIILAFVWAVYYRTKDFLIIVDDIKHYNDIFRGAWDQPDLGWRQSWHRRLYGGGSFAKRVPCDCSRKDDNGVCLKCKGALTYVRINSKHDHLFTTAIFSVTCALIYWAFGHNDISLCAALLYAVHPVNTSTSIWLNGRRYAVSIALMLVMMLFPPLTFFAYFATTLLQVNTILAPIVLGWWYMLAIPFVVIMGFKRYKRFFGTRMKDILNPDMHSYDIGRAVIVVKTFGFYVMRMLVPGRTQMVYQFISGWGMTEKGNKEAYRLDKYFYIGLLSLILSVGCLATTSIDGQVKLYIAFAVLATLQFCNIIAPTQTSADRYINAPNVFVMYLVSLVLFTFVPGHAVLLAAIFGTYLLSNTAVTMRMFKDITAFYEYHNYFDPSNVILRKFRANWLIKTGDVLGAWELIKTGLLHDPTDFTMLYQAGVCMHIMGDSKMSNEYLDRAEANMYIAQGPRWKGPIDDIRRKNDLMKRKRVAMQPADWKGRK